MSKSNGSPKRQRVEGVPNLYKRCRDGAFEAGFTGSDGKWHIKTLQSQTLTDAKIELRKVLGKRDDRTDVAPSRLTFAQVFEDFMDGLEAKVAAGERAERTLGNYRSLYRARLETTLGRREIQKITTEHIATLIAEWQAAGLSAWTIKTTLTPLTRVFNYAVRRNYVPANPVSALEDDEKPKIRKTEKSVLSPAEVDLVLDCAPEKYRAVLATAAYTGARQAEVLGLTWGDIDFDEGVIRFRAQLTRATAKSPARRVMLKTEAARRTNGMLPVLAEILQAHRTAEIVKGNGRKDDFVFTTELGSPMYYRNVLARGLTPALERAGLDDRGFTFHGFRHTMASRLILDLAMDENRVAKWIGHTNASFTRDTYTHVYDDLEATNARDALAATGFGAAREAA